MRKKFAPFLALFLCIAFIVSSVASAQEGLDRSVQKVRLKMMYVQVPNYDNVKIVRSETTNTAEVKLFDKTTGDLLHKYVETVEKDTSSTFAAKSGDFYIVTVHEEQTDGPAVTRLEVKMNVYSSGSFRQINSIESKKMFPVSSGYFTVEDRDVVAISATGSFPTTEIRANGTGVVTHKSTKTESGELAFTAGYLAIWGFNISYTNSDQKDFYARKHISMSLNYNLYPN
ncbi:hypothetical protein [Paenibacillus apiarius]|uniref:hypothetical protein n=1 Tax=Paenibacillus apiarius TaxID=46240 RepID=UPI0019808B46|nr:hypothetical protein [Paenibacillus apiarius]MBN3523997.1 hypothetical protein [Paenibacillus apiarius]